MFENIKKSLGIKTIDYDALIKGGAIIVDVRTPEEFKNGHSTISKNIPLQGFEKKLKDVKGKEVILVCLSGMRASQAKAILTKNGITCHNAGSWTRFKHL